MYYLANLLFHKLGTECLKKLCHQLRRHLKGEHQYLIILPLANYQQIRGLTSLCDFQSLNPLLRASTHTQAASYKIRNEHCACSLRKSQVYTVEDVANTRPGHGYKLKRTGMAAFHSQNNNSCEDYSKVYNQGSGIHMVYSISSKYSTVCHAKLNVVYSCVPRELALSQQDAPAYTCTTSTQCHFPGHLVFVRIFFVSGFIPILSLAHIGIFSLWHVHSVYIFTPLESVSWHP